LTSQRSAVDRILAALGHPVRRRILGELANGPGSASTLSRAFKMELGVVSYHLNQVLAKQCKVVELVDTVPRRGSLEKVYAVVGEAALDLPTPGEPGSWDDMLWTMALGQGLFRAVEASRSEGR
jgi:DNA-binding transcriptional ArsR family regulator